MEGEVLSITESLSNMIAKALQGKGYINVDFDADSVGGYNPTTGKKIKVTFEVDGIRLKKVVKVKQLNQ